MLQWDKGRGQQWAAIGFVWQRSGRSCEEDDEINLWEGPRGPELCFTGLCSIEGCALSTTSGALSRPCFIDIVLYRVCWIGDSRGRKANAGQQ